MITNGWREICEKDFHANLEHWKKQRRYINRFFIGGIKSRAEKEYYSLLCRNVKDRVVLDYGCGFGHSSFFLIQNGARKCIGIDISRSMIEQAKKQYNHNRILFCQMSCEYLGFPDNKFDLICGKAILHHLDFPKALQEIYRTLKDGGIAIFLEPLGHNPFIKIFRKLTPKARSAAESPLTENDIELCRKYFKLDHKEFLFTLIPFLVLKKFMPKKFFTSFHNFTDYIDRYILGRSKKTYKFFWISLLMLRKEL